MLLFQTSQEIIFYFQHFIQVCFHFLGKKLGGGGARAPQAPPLATALFKSTSYSFKIVRSFPIGSNSLGNLHNHSAHTIFRRCRQ